MQLGDLSVQPFRGRFQKRRYAADQPREEGYEEGRRPGEFAPTGHVGEGGGAGGTAAAPPTGQVGSPPPALPPPPAPEPIGQALGGEAPAWKPGHEDIVRQTGRLNRAAARIVASDPHLRGRVEPEDITQDAMLALMKSGFHGANADEFGKLAGTHLRRHAVNIRRKIAGQSREGPLPTVLQEQGPAEGGTETGETEDWEATRGRGRRLQDMPAAAASLGAEHLHRAVASLSGHHRAIVSAMLEGKEQAEIGQALGMTDRTVRRRMDEAKPMLRKILEDMQP